MEVLHLRMYLKNTAQDSYASIKLWWEAEIQNLNDWSDYVTKKLNGVEV
jgi:hypothetical protein